MIWNSDSDLMMVIFLATNLSLFLSLYCQLISNSRDIARKGFLLFIIPMMMA
jgi:hypothetical protein